MSTLPTGYLVAGKFRILEPLGSGGMGTVYKAEQLSMGRQVAVKLMRLPAEVSALEAAIF
jgi:eukaryotic-like serine/threonine-protein kinase